MLLPAEVQTQRDRLPVAVTAVHAGEMFFQVKDPQRENRQPVDRAARRFRVDAGVRLGWMSSAKSESASHMSNCSM